MCCFSGKVEDVSTTKIFARHLGENRQGLIYQMKVEASQPVAMILPIPVAMPATEESLKFHDLSAYKNFFSRLDLAFPIPRPYTSRGAGAKKSAAAAVAPTLRVHQVGSFEASFVPTIKDFSRLDKRFQMPKGVWDSLPQYKDYGFAVFQLKFSKEGKNSSHPMAFEFTSREPKKLFFPTVHVHDGTVEDTADFDHALYCQGDEKSYQKKPKNRVYFKFKMLQKPVASTISKQTSTITFKRFTGRSLATFVDPVKARGLTSKTLPAHKLTLQGEKTNADLWVSFVPIAAPKKIVAKKTKSPAKKAAPKKPAKKAAAKRRRPLPKR